MSSNNLLDTTRRYVEDAFGCFTKTNHYAHDKFYEKLADQVLEGVGFRNKHNRFAGYNDKQQREAIKEEIIPALRATKLAEKIEDKFKAMYPDEAKKIASNPLGNIQLFCQGAYDFFSYRVCCGLNDLICSKGSNDHISELGKAAGIHAMPEMKEVTIGPKQADGRHKYDPNVTLRNAITRFNASLEDEQLVERLAKHITHHMPDLVDSSLLEKIDEDSAEISDEQKALGAARLNYVMGLNINSGRPHALVKVIQNDLELDAEIASYLQTANEVPAEDKFDQMRDKVEATYNPISRQPIAMERLGEELNREPAALGGSTTVFQAQAEVRTQTQPAQPGGMLSRFRFGGS